MLNQQKKQSDSIFFSPGNTGTAGKPLIQINQQNQKLQKQCKERARVIYFPWRAYGMRKWRCFLISEAVLHIPNVFSST